MIVRVYKAQPTGSQLVPDLALTAEDTLPEDRIRETLVPGHAAWMAAHHAFFTAEARMVVDALEASLPGGCAGSRLSTTRHIKTAGHGGRTARTVTSGVKPGIGRRC